jgi:putative glutamine amidotransferase
LSKPLVGITAWRRTLDTYYGADRLQTLSTFYTDSIIDAGMIPVMLPNGQDPADAARLVTGLDGLLLSGGDDVDPESYGVKENISRGHDRDVDRFEIALVQAAREQGKPVLAICRGLQLLNVALGGTLNQDVTSDEGVHERFTDTTTAEEMNARRHVVRFEEGSLLADLYGSVEAKVNTLHHQGVEDLAPALVIEGRTDDGLIEAARCDGSWWALGVQWHPERMEGDHQSIFSAFRRAIEGL